MTTLRLLLTAAILAPAAPLLAQLQFQTGDVYLHSSTLPLSASQNYSGIVRVDPNTGLTTPFASLGHSTVGRFAYDPYRDRLLVATTGSPLGTWAIDGSGGQSLVCAGAADAIAPRGDGIVYFFRPGVAPNYVPSIGFFDAGGDTYTLLDVGGAQPWPVVPGQAFNNVVRAMIYDGGENALFLAYMGDAQTPTCTGPGVFDVTIRKVPLTSIGSALRAPASCTTFSVTGVTNAPETPLQWSRGPGGDLMLAVQTNQGGAQARLVRVTPSTMATAGFATVGPYPGDQAIACGAYVPSIGKALIWDGGNKVFRTYAPGDSGSGTMLAPYGNSPAKSDLVVIGGSGLFAPLRADTFAVSTSAGGVQNLFFVPNPSQAGNAYLIVGSLSGWTPGLTFPNGVTMPINYDAFTDLTLTLAGSPLMPGAAGTVPAGGIVFAQVIVPPGVLNVLAGFKLHFAGIVAAPGPVFTKASNAVPLRLLP